MKMFSQVLDYFPRPEPAANGQHNGEESREDDVPQSPTSMGTVANVMDNIPMFCLPMGAAIECWPDRYFRTSIICLGFFFRKLVIRVIPDANSQRRSSVRLCLRMRFDTLIFAYIPSSQIFETKANFFFPGRRQAVRCMRNLLRRVQEGADRRAEGTVECEFFFSIAVIRLLHQCSRESNTN